MRGFGARAAFGIRGIKIVIDGIPETTPDGQGQLDNLPLGMLKSFEVLRGPSASLYGNASGGVIYLNTIDNLPDDQDIQLTSSANILIGSNGAGKTNVLESVSLLSPGRGIKKKLLSKITKNQSKEP